MNALPIKKTFLIILISPCLSAQIKNDSINEPRTCITAGILNGGGGLLGADLEFLLTKELGVQIGAGFFSFGAGENFHLKPSIRSSFISVNYWYQGFGSNHVQSVLGPTFVYRAKKIFAAQIGAGLILEKGEASKKIANYSTPAILLYSIGIYFPIE